MGEACVCSLRNIWDIPNVMPNLIYCFYRFLESQLCSQRSWRSCTVKWRREGVVVQKICMRHYNWSFQGYVLCAYSCGLERWNYKGMRSECDCKVSIIRTTGTDVGEVSRKEQQQLGSPKQHMTDTLTISTSLIDPDFSWSYDINICHAKMSINYTEIQA